MKAEKLKDLKKAGEGKSLDEIEIAPGGGQDLPDPCLQGSQVPEPRNVIGLQKDLPVEEMEADADQPAGHR